MIPKEDLNIGNTVLYKGFAVRVSIVSENGSIGITAYGGKSTEIVQEKDIDPIPLTPELLKDNGFKQGHNYHLYFIKNANEEIRILLDGDRSYVKSDYNTVHCRVYALHELQNVLRMCRIKREIKPFDKHLL